MPYPLSYGGLVANGGEVLFRFKEDWESLTPAPVISAKDFREGGGQHAAGCDDAGIRSACDQAASV